MKQRSHGRLWSNDFIRLSSFMRQRAILRLARNEEMSRASETAMNVLRCAWPDAHYFFIMWQIANELGVEAAVVFYLLMINNQSCNARVLYWFYSAFIRRPLTYDGDYTYRMAYHKWPNPTTFAQLFRVPSLELLQKLAILLRLPEEIHGTRVVQGQPLETYVADGVDALAVCLSRLCFPGRLSDLKHRLQINWSIGKISSIINATVMHLFETWRKRVLFDGRVFANHNLLRKFAAAIHRVGAPFMSCVGFIDGTTFHISRPGGGDLQQAVFYSGHKRAHVVRWQGVVTPDGMVSSFYGPHQGASNDRGLLNVSRLDETLVALFGQDPTHPGTTGFFLYGDAGYDSNGRYTAVYTPSDLPDNASREAANSARVAVENVYGILKGE